MHRLATRTVIYLVVPLMCGVVADAAEGQRPPVKEPDNTIAREMAAEPSHTLIGVFTSNRDNVATDDVDVEGRAAVVPFTAGTRCHGTLPR